MQLYYSLAERYRRHRAIHQYDYAIRFWLLDSLFFVLKMLALTAIVLSLLHFGRQLPAIWSSAESVAAVDAQATASAPASPEPGLVLGLVPSRAAVRSVVVDSSGAVTDDSESNTDNRRLVVAASSQPTAPFLKTLTITATRVNLREGPGKENPVIAQLSRGTRVSFFGLDGNWVEVGTHDINGVSGFVHGSLIDKSRAELEQLQRAVSP